LFFLIRFKEKSKMNKKRIVSLLLAVGFLGLTCSTALASYEVSKYAFKGYVKEKSTLKPLAGAKVKIYKNNKLKDSDKASKSGAYKFKKLKKGTYKIKASLTGYRNPSDVKKSTVSKTVKVKSGAKKNLYMVAL